MSLREQILDALEATLQPILPAAVWRSRMEQLTSLPAIVITPMQEEDPGVLLGCTDSTLTVAIAIYARSDIPDQAADPILTQVLSALKADSTLGLGSDVNILPTRRIEWQRQNYDDGSATLLIDILYRTY